MDSLNLSELEELARARLPKQVWDYYSSGADDERTLRSNAEAYARRYRYIRPVVLPRGVAHLAADVPPQDITLIATTTSLVAAEDTHPAIVQLFVQAAARIHADPGWIARAGQFPSAQGNEFPLAKEAERYYRTLYR